MSYDISALKVLFKKIFPPKKCIFTVDSNGDGETDSLLIKALNVIMAMEIPEEIELGGFSTKNFDITTFQLSDYGKMYIDEHPIDVSKEKFDVISLMDHFSIYLKGKKFTIKDILSGKLAGKIIGLGDFINILISIDKESLKIFQEGKHTFKFESELIPTLEFNFELTKDNLNQKFDPNKP
jgi:hypothetical protein